MREMMVSPVPDFSPCTSGFRSLPLLFLVASQCPITHAPLFAITLANRRLQIRYLLKRLQFQCPPSNKDIFTPRMAVDKLIRPAVKESNETDIKADECLTKRILTAELLLPAFVDASLAISMLRIYGQSRPVKANATICRIA